MIPQDFRSNECCDDLLLGISGATFSTDKYIVATAANTAVVLTPVNAPGNYQFIEITLESLNAAAIALAITLLDNSTGLAGNNTFVYNGTLKALGNKTVIRLPYIPNLRRISCLANALYVITSIEFVIAPDAYEFSQTPYGSTGEITGAITGAGVTDGGFSALKQASFTLTTANTGGMTYTFVDALVAAPIVPPLESPNPAGQYVSWEEDPDAVVVPTYYTVLLYSPITASLTIGGLTHTFRGYCLLTLDSISFSALTLALSIANASGATITMTMNAFAANMNYAANAWKDRALIGVA